MVGTRIATLMLASLVLAAFSPPQSKREPAQQEPPKSWRAIEYQKVLDGACERLKSPSAQ
jgi:hypothetical protein